MTVHNIERCNYCRDILTILVAKDAIGDKSKGLRFTQLSHAVRILRDEKIAKSTLLRHLEPLRKQHYIAKKKIGPENVVHFLCSNSPLFTNEGLAFQLKLASFYEEKFSSISLRNIVLQLLKISRMADLVTLKTQLKATYGKMPWKDARLATAIYRNFSTYYVHRLMGALSGKEPQYIDVLNDLDEQIRGLENEMTVFIMRTLEQKKENR